MSAVRHQTSTRPRGVAMVGVVLTLGLMIALFSSIDSGTPTWRLLVLSSLFGSLSSLQYSSLNSLVFADVPPAHSGSASSIAGTAQQLSLSFGIAISSLLASTFIPHRALGNAVAIVSGVHSAFLVMGTLTVLSVASFLQLRKSDGASTLVHTELH